MRTIIFLMLLLVSGAAFAGYLPPGAKAAAGARHIVLIYNGRGHRKWVKDDFKPLLAYADRDGRLLAPMFDTFLVLPLGLDNDRSFCPGFGSQPADMKDIVAYRDQRLFGGDDQLRKLDDAAGEVAKTLHAPALRWKVILTLPYPDPKQRHFGNVAPGGPDLDLSRPTDRLTEMQWYLRTCRALWDTAQFRHLDLIGWYWVSEASEGPDGTLLPLVGKEVRAGGGKFFWIPWFHAPGAADWKRWGFDAAIHQPNYFFPEYTGPSTRLPVAAAFAREHGMGVEIELDERLEKDPALRTRYREYLKAGRTEGYENGALTAWYMGEATLLGCAWSQDPDIRALYDETYAFIAGK